MPFEEIDNKAREAADLHHPTYHEDAWGKMEKLLDEHMPQKKEKKRRFIFWWLLPLLIGGATSMIWQPWKGDKSIAKDDSKPSGTTSDSNATGINSPLQEEDKMNGSANTNPAINPNTDLDNNTSAIDSKDKKGTTIEAAKTVTKSLVITGKQDNHNNIFTATTNKILTGSSENNQVVNKKIKPNIPEQTSANQNSVANTTSRNETAAEKNDVVVSENKSGATLNTISNNSPLAATGTGNNTDKKEQPVVETPVTTEPVATVEKKEKPSSIKKKKPNSFFLTFSAGPDVSFVSGNKTGTSQITGGAGIGYSIKDKIVLRTGFYTGHKVYSAAGYSYHGSAAFYQYYPYLEKVNADCEIYEIPVSVSFNFIKRKKHNFFASAGVSSLLMKKENYDYFYKYTATGTTHQKSWSVSNENKHYFSVLTLSGGYQHSLGKKIIFMAEPYIKMPLSGIGTGKVKMGSTGVLFTVGIKPF
jgi:hypothetical protein